MRNAEGTCKERDWRLGTVSFQLPRFTSGWTISEYAVNSQRAVRNGHMTPVQRTKNPSLLRKPEVQTGDSDL